MKKYSLYIIITTVLLVVALVIWFNDKPGTLDVKNNAFAIADTSGITHIQFIRNNQTLTLSKTGRQWFVNNTFHARPKAIATLLSMLMQIEIQSPVPKNKQTAALNTINKNAVKVLIGSDNKTIKSFWIADNDSLQIGSLAKLDDDDEAYIASIPKFEGKLSLLFHTDPKMWRDKSIFRYRPSEIQSIKVMYPDNPKASFMYEFKDFNNILIKSLNTENVINIDKETARGFLMNFSSLSYERPVIKRTRELMDSLNTQKPLCEIVVRNSEDKENKMSIYRIPAGVKKQYFDLNRVYAVIQNDTVPVIVKYTDIDPITKEFADFSGQ